MVDSPRDERDSRPAREFDVFVPLHDNDGAPVEADKLAALRRCLVERFGGMTDLRQRSEGHWKVGGVTFRDEVVIYRILAPDGPETLAFFQGLKEDMKRSFGQEDVLIVMRDVATL